MAVIGSYRHRNYWSILSNGYRLRLAGRKVPEFDGAAVRARESVSPIGRYRRRAFPGLLTPECAEELSKLQVPELRNAVV